MSDAVISNRIYLKCEVGSELESYLVKNLRREICQQPISPYPKVINNVIRVTPTIVSIPKGCIHHIPEDFKITHKTVKPEVIIPPLNVTLRPNQQECVDFLKASGLVEAKPGWGKTFAGLALAHKHQTKTLIVTTTTIIRDGWIKEIKKYMGFDPGIIGSGKFDTSPPIVVGNIQTIRNRLNVIRDMFGLVIIDEVHRAPAATFTDTLDALRNELSVGLSGTLIRKDMMHIVLPDYFGEVRFIGKDENREEPIIHIYDCDVELSANEFIPWAVKVNELMRNPIYINLINDIFNAYVALGHKVLVVADRVEFLEHHHLANEDKSFLITGKIKGEELRTEIMNAVSEFDGGVGLFATQSIFSEGVSLNELSALILATPISNDPLLEQIIGRIQRSADTKTLQPVVIDINFKGSTGRSQANTRRKFYIEKGWIVKKIN